MRNRFDKELELLNNELIEMGSLVERAIEDASKALISKDLVLAKKVISSDDEINSMEKNIENKCLRLLLQQHPVAGDLRLISSILKIITDLERIGDQAQDIAEISLCIMDQNYIKELIHLPEMAKTTVKMVKDSIDAFINKDMDLAKKVILEDDIIDDLFDIIKEELISLIRKDIGNGHQAIDFLMIAKYFERIGDHAQNIAEWVLFSITGVHEENI
ncbi:phosphate signaling complex protein PhoU [Wansuia hejianensis]|uniref:Phosphate-specific transport system accessory protein PhoU n=1 Tax=Wansuia hejianensis TaxID=2763667 RepID=A0A926F1P6_9FIRM|nr:phosphate signaling complex protein PhoU [Wansuia hejianensis]MBC8590392.1 phosphate signaling complex protein PhoU [Wansuia hejianensis]